MYKRFIYIILLALSITSCHDDPTYKVDAALNEYLQRFLNEGAVRGRNFDLKEQGIIVEFGDLEGSVAGRCYYEDPVRIVLDKAYWDNLALSSNGEELRENVIFHELGHGLLDRRHINNYLVNGDWKSMMCGGTVVDNRSWNINYRAIRRQYYLDELFNSNTPTPYWATKIFTDSVTEIAIVEDEFIIAPFWPIGDNYQYTASVSNGIYSFYNKGEDGIFLGRPVLLETTADFYIETSIKIEDESADTQCGLLFGYAVGNIVKGNYYNIDNNRRMFFGNTTCYGWYTELIKPELNVNDFNVIGIRKIGSEIYFYINGQCVYYDQLSINELGNAFGFEIAGSCTLLVDYFHVYTNTLKSARIIDFSVKEPMKINKSKGIWLNK